MNRDEPMIMNSPGESNMNSSDKLAIGVYQRSKQSLEKMVRLPNDQ